MQKSKTKLAFFSVSAGGIQHAFDLVFKFVMRGFFLHYFTAQYLGLSSTILNILAIISMVNLGIPDAIHFALFKPMEEKNWGLVKTINALFRKMYRIFGIAFLVISAIVAKFLPVIIKEDISSDTIYKIYFICVLLVVSHYFLIGKRSLLEADSRQYIIIKITFICDTLITNIVSLIIVIFLPLGAIDKFLVYLSFTAFMSLIVQFLVYRKSNKEFLFIESFEKVKISKEIWNDGKKRFLGILIGKISRMLSTGLDNILIAVYVSVSEVAMFGNYMMIIYAFNKFYSMVINFIFPGLGRMIAVSDNKKIYTVFQRLFFFTFCAALISSAGIVACSKTFITAWIGEQYLYNSNIFQILLAYLLFSQICMSAIGIFLSASGLQWNFKYWSILSAIINISISVFCFQILKIGVLSVIISTISVGIILGYWVGSYVFYKRVKVPYYVFIKSFIKFFGIFFGVMVITMFLSNNILLIHEPWISFFANGLTSFAIASISILIFFRKTAEFSYTLDMMIKLKNKTISKIRRISL